MEILFLIFLPFLVVCLIKPNWFFFAFPLMAFFSNRVFGSRTLDDIYSSKIPYGFLLSFAILFSFYITNQIKKRENLFSFHPLLFPSILMIATGLLSIVDTVNLTRGMKFLLGWMCYIVFFYVLTNTLRNYSYYKYYLLGNTINAFVLSVLVLLDVVLSAATVGETAWKITWLTTNEIGFYLEPVFFICASLLLYSSKRIQNRWFLVLLLCMIFVTIIYSGTRGTWLSIFATSIILLFYISPKDKIKTVLVALVACSVFYYIYSYSDYVNKRFHTLKGLVENSNANVPRSSIETRRILLAIGYNMIKDNMLNGVGLGNYAYFYGQFSMYAPQPELNQLVRKPHTPHNFFMRYGAETGILGLSAILYLLIAAFRDMRCALKQQPSSFWKGLILGCYLGFISNFIHCLFQERIFSFYYWSFLAVCYATLYHAAAFSNKVDRNRLEIKTNTTN